MNLLSSGSNKSLSRLIDLWDRKTRRFVMALSLPPVLFVDQSEVSWLFSMQSTPAQPFTATVLIPARALIDLSQMSSACGQVWAMALVSKAISGRQWGGRSIPAPEVANSCTLGLSHSSGILMAFSINQFEYGQIMPFWSNVIACVRMAEMQLGKRL